MKRIPLLLYTYLLTEMLAPFFAALLVINAVLFLGRLVPMLDEIFSLGVGMGDFLRVVAYITPSMLLFSLPMAAMMAVIIAFTRLAGDLEIMAFKASGISLPRMLPPVVFFGLLTGLLTLLTATVLIPRGVTAMDQLLLHMAKERIEEGVQAKTFSEGLGEVVLYVDEVTTDNRSWRGVYLSDLRDQENPLTISAQGGNLRADPAGSRVVLNLTDGSLHRTTGDKSQTIFFQRYQLELPLPSPTMGSPDRSGMTQAQLRQKIAELEPEDHQRYRYISEYHQRLALPVGCFLLAMLGLSLSQLGQSSRLALGVPLGLASFVAYYVLLTAAKALAEQGQLPMVLAIWLPNLLFLLLGGYLLWRSALELGNPWLERLLLLGQQVGRRWRQRFAHKTGDDNGAA